MYDFKLCLAVINGYDSVIGCSLDTLITVCHILRHALFALGRKLLLQKFRRIPLYLDVLKIVVSVLPSSAIMRPSLLVENTTPSFSTSITLACS